jgi:hypothetical protein
MNVAVYIVHATTPNGTVIDDEGLNDSYSVAEYGAEEALRLAEEHLEWLTRHFDGEILAVGSE